MSVGGDHLALAVKRDGRWQKWTFDEYLSDTEAVAKAFIKLGLQPRHGVAIIGFNAPEWSVKLRFCAFVLTRHLP